MEEKHEWAALEGRDTMKKVPEIRFDLSLAKGIVDSYYSLTGVQSRIYSSDGTLVYEQGSQKNCCEVCRSVAQAAGRALRCEQIHLHGMKNAEQFGGRYIYFCPMHMVYYSSPIIIGGAQAGAFVCGPVLMMDVEDYLEDESEALEADPEGRELFRRAVELLPQVEPRQMNYLSQQLFADAVYVSDSVQELLILRSKNQHQGMINDYIQQLKRSNAPQGYPVKQEQELLSMVAKCNQEEGEKLLNEVLSVLFYSYSELSEIYARIMELVVIMSRAAIYSGADAEQVLEMNTRFGEQARMLRRQEDTTQWLQSVMRQFMNIIHTPPDTKHRNLMDEAMRYIQKNYRKPLTLEKVAEFIGYSPSYFSKVFKQETGTTFRNYLNQLRIEKSKSLLLSSSASISEICSTVAFEDQSYFCKVFKKFVGVTPDRYRKRERRLNFAKEHGEKGRGTD